MRSDSLSFKRRLYLIVAGGVLLLFGAGLCALMFRDIPAPSKPLDKPLTLDTLAK